ncbi:MAG: T9SS type A sorting domain-containing protein [Bacteroidetes bacterium]|nr:T9SS type A sorting domain-containing protein [Bacteroidota bacterium]
MNKFIKLSGFFAVLFNLSIQAQITIESSDFASPGISLILATDTQPSGISIGGTGFQNWDFSSLNTHEIDTFNFTDPYLHPVGQYFPGANLVGLFPGTDVFYKHFSSQTSMDGFFGFPGGGGMPVDSSMPFNLTDDLILLTYPSTFGTNFYDTGYGDTLMSTDALPQISAYADSIYIRFVFRVTSIFDAFGPVTTPYFTDTVIRQYVIQIFEIDSAMAKGGFFPFWTDVKPLLGLQPDTTYLYYFRAKGKYWPLAEITMDSTGVNPVSVRFLKELPLSGYFSQVFHPSCYGLCDGQATFIGTNGTPPYTYLWTGIGQTGATATGLCSGSWSVLVKDAGGDSLLLSVVLTEPAQLGITADTIIKATCPACPDGSISVSISGGTPPYAYTWEDASSDSQLVNLLPGFYAVTVTDSKGCTAVFDSIQVLSGIGEFYSRTELVKFYPNPVRSVIQVINRTNSPFLFEVSDFAGNILIMKNTAREETEIYVKNLNAGIYLVNVKNSDGDLLHKGRIAVMR